MWWIIACLLLANAVSATSKNHCPDTIAKDKYTKLFGTKCYRFEMDIKKEYEDAEAFCVRRGGHLVMIKSQEINDFLQDQLVHSFDYDETLWIGLNDMDDENEFEWVDGSKMAYSNFASDEEGPRGGIKHPLRHRYEDCVAMDAGHDGKWKDYRCEDYFWGIINEHKRFICEYDAIIPDTTPAPTTTTTTPTTTTTTTTAETTSVCPNLYCDLDCGMEGFKTNDVTGCMLCQCDVDTPDTVVTSTSPPETTSSRHQTASTTTPTDTLPPSSSNSTLGLPSTTKEACKEIKCQLNCDMLGYRVNKSTGCTLCECNQ